MDSIREGVKKPWAKFVIFGIVISFVGAGYFTSTLFSGDPFAAATVNGESISVREFQRAYSRARQQYGEMFEKIVKTPEQKRNFNENVLQGLIARKVIQQTSRELGLRVSKKQIRKTIQAVPTLQNEGVYSSDLLDQALVRIGQTREQFKQDLVSDAVLRQLTSGVTGTEFVLPSESSQQFKILGQARTGRVLPIKYSLFNDDVNVTEEEISAYYQENLESFRLPEKISLDYIELSIEELQKGIEPSEEEIQVYYDDNLEMFRSEEERRVSHILIAGDSEESLAKATELKSKLDGGADFVELVKSDSSDEFSAENDGDLGVLNSGDMEESFDLAMNQLKNIGDISAPVKTSFGYHIIKLTELIEGTTQTLDEVKTQIVSALQKSTAEEAFFAKSKILEEKAFEISDSLVEVSELTGLKVKTSPVFTANKASGIFANQEVKDAAFGENVLLANMNSNLVNISDGHVVVLHLKSHEQSRVQELDDVKTNVVTSLTNAKARESAIAYAESLQEKILSNSVELSKLLAEKDLIWKDLNKVTRNAADIPYRQMQQFFKLAKPSESSTTIEIMKDVQELAILILNQVEDGKLAIAEKSQVEQYKQRLTRFYANAAYVSLVEQERNQAEVTRNLENINR